MRPADQVQDSDFEDESEYEFEASSAEEQGGKPKPKPKEIIIQGACFPDYEPQPYARDEIGEQVFTALFMVQPYGDIPYNQASDRMIDDASASMRNQARGKNVAFGAEITLKHYISGMKLKASDETGNVFGTRKITMSSKIGNGNVITIRPASKYVPPNSDIPHDAQVILSFDRMPTASNIMLINQDEDENSIYLGTQPSPIKVNFFNHNEVSKFLMVSVPCHIQAKGHGFFLGASETSVQYVDAKDSSTVWTIFNTDPTKGGFVDMESSYLLFNIESGYYMGENMELVTDEQAIKFSLHPVIRGEKRVTFNEEIRISSDNRMLGVNSDTNHSISLRSMYPKTTKSETPDVFTLSLGTAEQLHQLHTYVIMPLEDSATQLFLLNDLRSSIDYWTEDLKTNDFDDMFKNMDEIDWYKDSIICDLKSIKNMVEMIQAQHMNGNYQEKALITKLKLPTSLLNAIFTFLDIKKSTKDHITKERNAKTDKAVTLQKLLTFWKDTYAAICNTLIQILKTDYKACFQIKKKAETNLNRIVEDSEHLPIIVKLTQSGGVADMPQDEVMNGFRMWMGALASVTTKKVVKQNVVVSSLSCFIRELSAGFMDQFIEELRKADLPLRKYSFLKRGNSIYVNFLPETAFKEKVPLKIEQNSQTFLALDNLADDNFAEFTASLLNFYDSCSTAFDPAVNQELFGEVGISHDLIVALVSSEASPLLVRSEALRVLASFIPPAKRETSLKRTLVLLTKEVSGFEQVFERMRNDQSLSENAALLKKCFTHSSFTEEDSLLEMIKFATSVFAFAKALVASESVMIVEIVQRYALSALSGWSLDSRTASVENHKGNWVFLCIKDARKEQKAELVTQLNSLLDMVFATLKCCLDVKEDLLLRRIVGKCLETNWALEKLAVDYLFSDSLRVIDSGLLAQSILPRDYTEEELAHLPRIEETAVSIFSAQAVALDMSFPLTEETYDLLLRVSNPMARVKARLSEVLLAMSPCRELEGIMSMGNIEAAEVSMVCSLQSLLGEELIEATRQQANFLNTKCLLLQDLSIRQLAQTVAIREETFQVYLKQWDKIQMRLQTALAAEEKFALKKLACCIFRYCTLLVINNPEAKEIVLRCMSHPLSDFEKSDLELVDLGDLIRELNDFALVRVETARTFFSFLHSKYYKKSLEATGAYEWFPAVLVNYDGTIKRDLQGAAYAEIRESLAKEDLQDQSGAYPMLLKQATLCTLDNKEIRAQVSLELPVDKLLALINASQAPDLTEAVALVLGRVHAPVLTDRKLKGDPEILQILQKILEIAKTVLEKEEEVVDVLQAGLYEQVYSKLSPNIGGWFLTQQQFAVVSLLRLVSSGCKPEPMGGIASCVSNILKAYTGENQDLKCKLATEFTEFYKQYQAFIAKLKVRLADTCTFTVIQQVLDSVLTENAPKKGPKVVEGSLILKGLGKAVFPAAKAEGPLLTPKLQAFVAENLKEMGSDAKLFQGLVETFDLLMNTTGSVGQKSEQLFLSTFKIISDLMVNQPSRKYLFKTLTAFTAGFKEIPWSRKAYSAVLKFWVTQMIAAKDLSELLDGVDFYLNFGNHEDTVRYDELLELLRSDQGPRLFLKIKKALAIEMLVRKNALKGGGKSIAHLIRKIRPGRFVTGADFRGVIAQHSQLVVAYINMLKAMCDNCNHRMQRFIRDQATDNDVDLVSEMVGFCSNILDLTLKTQSFAENRSLVLASIDAVADFCTGPCLDNQAIVGKNIKLFLGVNAVFRLKYGKDLSKETDPYVDLRKGTLHLLQVLLEGNASADILQTFQTYVCTDIMVTYITDVYKAIIEPNRTVIELGDFGNDSRHEIVEYAMDTSLFLVQYLNLSGIGLKEMLKIPDAVTAFREYYLQYCGYVEIFKPSPSSSCLDNIDNIWGVNFRIPFKCKLLTNESANALIVQVSHASHQEQLTDFMNQVEPLSKEMDHQLSIYHSEVLKFMTNHWGLYKDLSLYLVMLINLYVLIAFDTVRNFDPSDSWEVAVVLVGGIIQALFYFIGLVFHIVQRYPLILHAYSSPEAEEMEMDQLYGLPDHDSQKYKHFEEPCRQVNRTPNGCLAILCYLPTFTGLLYITASVLAIMYPLLSPVLLLTIIERKVEVQNVLKAVTQNKKQLALSGLLGVIIMYVFSVFAFLYFANFYENGENISCSTVLECLLTTINMGLRGGLADAMGNPDTKDVYWMRYTFDILFHLIIIILLMSVLFGIIIDTFGKLRDERTELYDKINNSCYVCDQTRNRIELGGKGWSYHFQVEHSPFAYLAYLVRLKDVPEQERNGIESYVHKLFTESDSSFFPSTSRHLIQALN